MKSFRSAIVMSITMTIIAAISIAIYCLVIYVFPRSNENVVDPASSLVSEVGGKHSFAVYRITIDGNNYLVARGFNGISIIPETKK